MRLHPAALVTLVSGLLFPGTVRGQVSFGVYVSVGDSLAAGFSNGSLVETHQRSSVPALLARQANVSGFEQPLVSDPGIPPELALVSLFPAVTLAPKAAQPGSPLNLGLNRPYNNLAVPAATVEDALVRLTGGYHDLVLRGLGSQAAQAAALHPTLVTLWIGNNDVLGAVVRGRAVDGVTLTPVDAFRNAYQQLVATLKATGAVVIAANLPDVSAIPFANTIGPFVVDPLTGAPVLANGQPVPLLGPTGPLPTGSLVTLAAASFLAQGIGIPSALGGTGLPLPDEVVLDPAEVTAIRDRVNAFNQIIRDVCQQAAVPVLDVHALLDELATRGREVGGVTLGSDFLTGGIFGYDGVHPTDLGYAVVANEWIAVINANGGRLPLVDLAPFLGLGARAASGPAAARARAGLSFDAAAYAGLLRAFPRLDARSIDGR
jgi:lysophospholipase L1-like esterase